jgi:hypothetical protein
MQHSIPNAMLASIASGARLQLEEDIAGDGRTGTLTTDSREGGCVRGMYYEFNAAQAPCNVHHRPVSPAKKPAGAPDRGGFAEHL